MHILNSSRFSGAENVIITIINQMKSDYELYYVSRDGTIREKLEQENIIFVPIKTLSITEIRKIVVKYKPDLIHAHDFTASIICSAFGWKQPVISHLHNNSLWLRTYHPYSFLYLLTSIMYKKILMVSPSVLEEYVFRKYIEKKSRIVGNPNNIANIIIKSNAFQSDSYFDIVFIGRLTEQKNPLRFIRIIEKVLQQADVTCAMIGQGELEVECRTLIEEHKLEKEIKLLGFLDNPYPILKQAKILCITSDWEGYGLVAVEALANGIPVLATAVGGLPTIVDDKCGKICNNNGEFVEEIVKLNEEPDYYSSKSKQALHRADELNNIESYIASLKQCYEQMLTER